MKKKPKYYVVWKGRKTGVFGSWEECFQQVHGFEDAQYKSFPTQEEAEIAFHKGLTSPVKQQKQQVQTFLKPIKRSICVDAACSVTKQLMEYRGVFYDTGKVLFHRGPYEGASNNIGEFLAIVHAMAYMKQNNLNYPVYSDSNTAISWVLKKHVNTKIIVSEPVKLMIEKALTWLYKNKTPYELLKWNTALWGEIPADFGRK